MVDIKRGITMEQGWINLHRGLLKKPIWIAATDEQKVLLMTLLMMANHLKTRGNGRGH